jgi:hypothetical protein
MGCEGVTHRPRGGRGGTGGGARRRAEGWGYTRRDGVRPGRGNWTDCEGSWRVRGKVRAERRVDSMAYLTGLWSGSRSGSAPTAHMKQARQDRQGFAARAWLVSTDLRGLSRGGDGGGGGGARGHAGWGRGGRGGPRGGRGRGVEGHIRHQLEPGRVAQVRHRHVELPGIRHRT